MKYVALLRGINVGGNNPVKMSELKTAFEKNGYTHVITYINSGNVIFESTEDTKTLTKNIEKLLSKTFSYNARVVVISQKQLEDIITNVPSEWNTHTDIRCYIAFLTTFLDAKDAAKEIELKEGVDSLKIGQDALYMTSKLSEITKSKFNRLASKKIYQEMTIRNYNTAKNLLSLMVK